VGGRLFFFGIPAQGGDEGLYKVENASSAPQLLKGGMSNTYQITTVGNLLYFAMAHYQPSYDDLWRSDGTSAGTLKIASYYSVKNIIDYNGTALLGILNNSGLELWKSNGTSATTVKIKDVTTPVLRHYELRPYGIAGGIYYFALDDGTHGFEMWRTNATAAGTFMIQDLRTDDTSFPMEYDIADAGVFNNLLYFSARDNAGVWALFKTGSNAGSVVKIKNLDGPGPLLAELNNTLLLFTESPDLKSHLWASDGTSEGTTHLKVLGTRMWNIDPAIVNNVMYFNVSNNTYDSEGTIIPTADEGMWRSDGTACGTFYFDVGAYRPFPMETLGAKLIFCGYTIKTGFEPYAYNTAMAPASPCDAAVATREVTPTSPQQALSFGPNPFTDGMRLRAEGDANHVIQVQVYRLSGEPVESLDNLVANEEHVIGQSWRPGIYLLKVFNGKTYYTERVIKR
jgi:ELWxxDGT repeat protein